jgi:hypothetical protein
MSLPLLAGVKLQFHHFPDSVFSVSGDAPSLHRHPRLPRTRVFRRSGAGDALNVLFRRH